MKVIKKLSDQIGKYTGYLASGIFIIMILACVLQVFTRYVLNNSLSWTEELARFAFIWLNLLGASICIQKSSHATVTAVLDVLSPGLKKVVLILIYLIIVFDGCVMAYVGGQVAYMTRVQYSAALSLNMAIVNVSACVSGVLIIIQALLRIPLTWSGYDERLAAEALPTGGEEAAE